MATDSQPAGLRLQFSVTALYVVDKHRRPRFDSPGDLSFPRQGRKIRPSQLTGPSRRSWSPGMASDG